MMLANAPVERWLDCLLLCFMSLSKPSAALTIVETTRPFPISKWKFALILVNGGWVAIESRPPRSKRGPHINLLSICGEESDILGIDHDRWRQGETGKDKQAEPTGSHRGLVRFTGPF